jgi:Zn-dependent protease with chaperone function
MTTLDAEKLVKQLEELNKTNKGAFRFRVWRTIMLGYLAVHILWIAALALLVFIGWSLYESFITGHMKVLLIALLVVAGLGLVGLVLMVVRLLFYQPPLPAGFEILEGDAPHLFAVLEEVRQKVNCKPFSHVYLNTELNASVVYIPSLMGLLPGETNLAIGLPLLVALNVDETKALLAHETAHMMRGRGSFGAWVYRNRLLWMGLGTYMQRIGGFLSGPGSAFFHWYVPLISAYSLVSSREFEYQADQLSVEVVGKEVTSRALLMVHALMLYMQENHLKELWDKAKTEPNVPEGICQEMLEAIHLAVQTGELNAYAEEALSKRSDTFDSHPSLSNRLAALDFTEAPDLTGAGETGLSLLKDSWETILPLSEIVMKKQFEEKWSNAHTEHLKDFIVLKRIHSADTPPHTWTHVQVLEYVQAARRTSDFETAWDWVNHFVELQPNDAIGFFIRGQMSFERQHSSCLDDFRKAATLDPKLAPQAYRMAIIFAERFAPDLDTTADREALHQAELRMDPRLMDA